MANKRIKDIATTITAFRTGDVIPVDGPSGTAKMAKDDLLREAAENALAGNLAPAFDQTRTSENPYLEGDVVVYQGKLYTFKISHYGAWSNADVKVVPLNDDILINKALSTGYEIFDDITFTNNKRIVASTGSRIDSSFWKSSFFVDVGNCDGIIFTMGTMIEASDTGVAFYDKNRSFISGITYDTASSNQYVLKYVQVPDGASFARFSAYNNDSLSGSFKMLKKRLNCGAGFSIDSTDKTRFAEGYRVLATDGTIETSSVWAASDFISVDKFESIEIGIPCYEGYGSTTGIAFYDHGKNFISDSGIYVFSDSTANRYYPITVKVPTNAAYMRCSRYNGTREESANTKFFVEFFVKDNFFVNPLKDFAFDAILSNTNSGLAICCSRDTIEDDKTPYSFGFLACKNEEDEGWLWYGTSVDKLKKFIQLDGYAPSEMNIAMSPSSNIIICAKLYTRGKLVVISNGVQKEIDDIEGTSPMGWLYNSGVSFFKDANNVEHCIFAEYTKNHPVPGGKFYVYKGTYPYDDPSLWKKVFSYDESVSDTYGTIIHFHQVVRDPWTGILYLNSGDSDEQLHWWYSSDDGETWNDLVDMHSAGFDWGSQVLRIVNFLFTKDYVYFATDREINHCLNRIGRDEDGVLDISSRVKLCDLPWNQASNSICLVERPHGIFGYDRIQGAVVLGWFYDLDNNELKTIFRVQAIGENPKGNRGSFYLHYTSLRTPNPIIAFNKNWKCVFDLNSKSSSEIYSIVYNIGTGQLNDISE